ncbi:RsmF rRNA methyltransferase first C-terminal domain-containing protein [Geosporobacter ferrireducens]|uniref:SAM-dependent methyltransferase n=1 Tax=Geosporobacter ferrireducens TaxID=1424294 RepID=A0A1D8GN80_9FIRM|nr:RsmB/NOP family class I SAM-dependent RNA methyltransferase [Geosporobacter ferrireducens]AOT72344.1 SAM-dependent methyltransferase [Geosporobacter ferrireducens]MTI56401.1 NOL1/NOP2/sun family putative RNA methylase [Geosporobacter ferrireducens]
MRLPEQFLNKMKEFLQDEYEAFLASYEQPRVQGLRINTLKISVEDFLKISPFTLEPVPWCKEGFYYREEDRPGKHPYYHAGLYYIQEPSAMIPVEILGAQSGERILDVCAAPGGKTVQLANEMKGTGLLVSNEINLNRVKALIRNIELFGIHNAIVTNVSAEKLVNYFEGFFDRILVDAPCSGEGMFRKDEAMVKSWEKQGPDYYISIQAEILSYMSRMLKSGGQAVYSTCTFSREENEAVIEDFLERHKAFQLKPIEHFKNAFGITAPVANHSDIQINTMRLWPHKISGEGHFAACLEKNRLEKEFIARAENNQGISAPREFIEFMEKNLVISFEGPYEIHGDQLYQVPKGVPSLRGLKVLRSGLLLGTLKKNRFEPSQAMAMALKKQDAQRTVDFSSRSQEVIKYLKGETLHIDGEKGWTLVCVDGFPLGWAKQTENLLKNEYPAAWRRLD